MIFGGYKIEQISNLTNKSSSQDMEDDDMGDEFPSFYENSTPNDEHIAEPIIMNFDHYFFGSGEELQYNNNGFFDSDKNSMSDIFSINENPQLENESIIPQPTQQMNTNNNLSNNKNFASVQPLPQISFKHPLQYPTLQQFFKTQGTAQQQFLNNSFLKSTNLSSPSSPNSPSSPQTPNTPPTPFSPHTPNTPVTPQTPNTPPPNIPSSNYIPNNPPLKSYNFTYDFLKKKTVGELKEIIENISYDNKIHFHWTYLQSKKDLISVLLDPFNSKYRQINPIL